MFLAIYSFLIPYPDCVGGASLLCIYSKNSKDICRNWPWFNRFSNQYVTEFKFQSASNFELNSLMFSNYKNTKTGKALAGISPHGSGILFSGIFPGSISDSKITGECGTVYLLEHEHEIMSDQGFPIQ